MTGTTFEPLESANLKWLSLKTTFLLALASAKKVRELQVMFIDLCRLLPVGAGVVLWPNPHFSPRFSLTLNQVRNLKFSHPTQARQRIRSTDIIWCAQLGRSECIFSRHIERLTSFQFSRLKLNVFETILLKYFTKFCPSNFHQTKNRVHSEPVIASISPICSLCITWQGSTSPQHLVIKCHLMRMVMPCQSMIS